MRELPAIVSEDAGLRVATWRNVMMLFWQGEVTAERLRATRPVQKGILSRFAEGSAVLTVVSDKTPLMMSSEARDEAAAQQRDFSPTHVGMATVIEGTGFFAATARSTASGIILFTRGVAPTKVFDSTDEAVRWLGPLLAAKSKVELTAADLRNAVSQARSAPRPTVSAR
jgi:hypothetical protein